LVGKSLWKHQDWRSRNRCEDNIKKDLDEVGCENVGYIEVAQDLVQKLSKFRVCSDGVSVYIFICIVS
jgi:hypothetical protein